MEDETPLGIDQLRTALLSIVSSFDDLLVCDLSDAAVDPGWSRIPHVGDHIQFLRDSTARLHEHLRSVAPGASVQRGDEDGRGDQQNG